MLAYLRHIDWKVIFFALVACYFLPVMLIGSVTANMVGEGNSDSSQIVANVSMFLYAFLPPFAAGYFTAKYAGRLPIIHVVIVGLIGIFIFWVGSSRPPLLYLAYGLASFAVIALGAFLRLRRGSRET